MLNVAVVILNWNGKAYLEKFLPSVIEHSKNARIIVADNASSDDSIQFLSSNYPQIEIIELAENYGFARGYNEALKQVNSEYYVLLNSDVEVTENWIEPIINLLSSNDNVVACQPKIKAYHNKDYFEYAGAAGGFIDNLGYPFCRGRIFEELEKDNGQYDSEIEIFWATGACLFIKSNAFHEVGGLDSFFFAHMEEIDLCWRLKNIGKKIMYSPLSTVYHVGGGTLNKTNPKKTFLNFRNSLLMLHKNLPKNKRLVIILKRLILDGIVGVKFILEGKFNHTYAIIKAHFSFYGALKQNKLKRPVTFNSKSSGVLNTSILTQYFFKKKTKYNEIEHLFTSPNNKNRN